MAVLPPRIVLGGVAVYISGYNVYAKHTGLNILYARMPVLQQ